MLGTRSLTVLALLVFAGLKPGYVRVSRANMRICEYANIDPFPMHSCGIDVQIPATSSVSLAVVPRVPPYSPPASAQARRLF